MAPDRARISEGGGADGSGTDSIGGTIIGETGATCAQPAKALAARIRTDFE
jgi:hypothetical protein